MYFLFFLGLAFACLVQADFYVFEMKSTVSGGINFHSLPEPGCANLKYSDWWLYSSDVSGNKQGCRVVPGPDPLGAPDVLECNTDFGHFTIYKNRNWGIFDLDDKQHGSCEPYTDYKVDCDRNSIYRRRGHSIFNCNTDIGTS